eukprot:TRINITY_DN26493_c0_g1_i1.p1 TRINITY_DN26493_c0_g1~~TRINITY_DN26493_c0_g1_i1.p1  ORF type:complete len:101 (+),score=5.77 TRINITY_DN26493_c0_g1_i1:162-464(+)
MCLLRCPTFSHLTHPPTPKSLPLCAALTCAERHLSFVRVVMSDSRHATAIYESSLESGITSSPKKSSQESSTSYCIYPLTMYFLLVSLIENIFHLLSNCI